MTQSLSMKGLISLCATDDILFCRTFFPQAFRMPSPSFHRDILTLLNDRRYRYVAVKVFRGSGKTTLLRAFCAKRIAYGASRFIRFVSKSYEFAATSVAWLKSEIETNSLLTEAFGLSPGPTWRGDYIEIDHKVLGLRIAVQPGGMTAQIRGANIGSFRPDLIIVDDPCDEENTGTSEAREKTADLLFGALARSLASSSDNPDSKLVLLQTPLHPEDLINLCSRDSQWASRAYSCFDEEGNSRWPELYPTEALLAEKRGYARRGQLHIWLREMEVTVTGSEVAPFRSDWLQIFDRPPIENMPCFIAVDPVPPPSERSNVMRNDFEVIIVVGVHQGNYYILDGSASRGHTPDWTVAEFFRLCERWRPIRARVEGVQYQRTIKWLLENEMQRRRYWVQINAEPDRRAKRHRILQAYSGIGSERRLFVHRDLTAFCDQFISYGLASVHDDWLDAGAMALEEAFAYAQGADVEDSFVGELVGAWRDAP